MEGRMLGRPALAPAVRGATIQYLTSKIQNAEVLIVEDDAAVRFSLRLTCEAQGWAVREARSGEQGLALLAERRPDLMLLDLMLPGMSGFEVAAQARAHDASLPIIMLTARSDEADKVRGLDSGADDYVTKPFSPRELAARIRAQLRKALTPTPARPQDRGSTALTPAPSLVGRGSLKAGNLSIDLEQRQALVNDRVVQLTPTEWSLLRYLAAAGRVVGRDELVRAVWHYQAGEGDSRLLDSHIRNLRAKLGHETIKTVRGQGYTLQVLSAE